MSDSETSPILGGRLTPRYRATLVAAALLILLVGAALRPARPSSKAAPAPSQTEVRRLQSLAERRSLETMAQHFAGIAQGVAGRTLRAGSMTGIVWSKDLVVTADLEPGQGATKLTTAAGEPLTATSVVSGPGLPLAALRVASPLEPAARREDGTSDLGPGQWVVAVWWGAGGHLFAPGHYLETRPRACSEFPVREVATSLPLAEAMAGGGLFDLDGNLIAVVLPCDGGYAALSLESVNLVLVQGRSLESRLRSRYGLRVAPLDPALSVLAGTESGALVNELWIGYPADRAGLVTGDVIVDVDGSPVTTPESLRPLLDPDAPSEAVLGVWRARRRREIQISARAREAPQGDAGSGLDLAPPDPGFRVGPVAPGSRAARGGIREGDQLLRVDFTVPRTRADASRALARDKPVFVEVRRGPRRLGQLLAAQ